MDETDYSNYPLGAQVYDDELIEHFAQNYRLLKPMADVWARLSFENKVWGVAEPVDTNTINKKIWNAEATPAEKKSEAQKNAANYTQHLDLGLWDAEVTYGRKMFWIDLPVGNAPASGGVLIAQLSDNEYLVTGYRARVTFSASQELKGKHSMIERVEEGHYENGKWIFERVWNGDQTDWGLNFTSRPHVLKVRMASYTVN
jgi:beta-galactosidase GanA